MTAASVVPPEVEEYLAVVRTALGDLPAEERDDLLVEVEASLVEAAGESGGPLAARLGPPDEFAAELRAAAGLHELAPPARPRALLARVIGELSVWAAHDPRALAVRRLGSELAPIWWVARAYIAIGAVAFATDASWSTAYPVVPRLGTGEIGLVAIGLAALGSIWIGLRTRRHGSPFPRLRAFANAALLVAAIPVAVEVADRSDQNALVAAAYAPQPTPALGLALDGVPIDNIYPYTRDGRLLHDVLLYDGSGRSLDIFRADDPLRRLLLTTDGKPIYNSFPVRYFEPGTMRVERPNAGPPVEIPQIATPPLMRRP